ncbi:hypothetical protein QWY86_00450 [Pedobacter aquatilis]|uniref:hypothetical protein n=1 Tax=Pedobacter aquatilis TaxID=351343 RepID=UPI0025B2C5B8|nr:hypothetical protein [Pedobacter aquatilis]MDN3585118.1 hypothetical protein [Pedobacter aquatilis]
MKALKTLFVLLSILSFSKSLIAQQQAFSTKFIKDYDSASKVAPREKLYVQLDRTIYSPQDTLWFKAYLTDAKSHTSSKISGLIYFEMLDSKGNPMQTICLPTAMGITWGGFALKPELYKDSHYTFRAYTNWSKNFGDDYIFKQNIQIVDYVEPESLTDEKNIPQTIASTSNSKKQSPKEIDVQFLPEGGNILTEIHQKIAFKAIDYNGFGKKIKGTIIDSKGNMITPFESNDRGMGYFTMFAEPNESYSAKFDSVEPIKNINLPSSKNSGTSVQLNNSYHSDSVAVHINIKTQPQEVFLIGQSRGIICFIAKLNAGVKSKTIKIAKSLFPTGVAQILLVDINKKPLNERSFFIYRNDELKINPISSLSRYTLRDSINIDLSVLNQYKKPVEGSFSIAVTDDTQIKKDSLNWNNIFAHMLLNSDLKGEIESPGYYLQNYNEQKHNELDALLLTQGWVNYNWDLSKKPIFEPEKDFTISGKVTNMTNKPIDKAQILLLGTTKQLSIASTTTNAKGEFLFQDFTPMDSVSFVLQAKNSKGKVGTLNIEVNDFKRPPFLPLAVKKNYIDNPVEKVAIDSLIATKKQENDIAFKSGIRLNEVKIIGKKTVRDSKNLNGPGNADVILNEEDLERVPKKTLYDLIKENVKGFRVNAEGKILPRIHFFAVDEEPLSLIIDGVNIKFFYEKIDARNGKEYLSFMKSYMDLYKAEDIKGIEVMISNKNTNNYINEYTDPFTTSNTAFVEVTTKSGYGPHLKQADNMFKYKPPTYGDNKTFYSPKYTAANKTNPKPDFRTTIYWNPNLMTDKNGKGNFSFFSADKKGTYTVWIEGTDFDSGFGFKTMTLNIGDKK